MRNNNNFIFSVQRFLKYQHSLCIIVIGIVVILGLFIWKTALDDKKNSLNQIIENQQEQIQEEVINEEKGISLIKLDSKEEIDLSNTEKISHTGQGTFKKDRQYVYWITDNNDVFKITGLNINELSVYGATNWDSYLLRYGKDLITISEERLKILGQVDEKTFRNLGSRIFQTTFIDKNHVFFIRGENMMILDDLDTKDTTEVIYNDPKTGSQKTFLKDSDTLVLIDNVNQQDILPLSFPGVDVATFVALDDYYYKDAKYVYRAKRGGSAEILKADIKTFEILGEPCYRGMDGSVYYAADQNQTYGLTFSIPRAGHKFLGRTPDGPESSVGYITDGKKIYRGCNGEVVDLDIGSFEIVTYYLKDSTRVLDWEGRLMTGIDPKNCTRNSLEKCNPDNIIPF